MSSSDGTSTILCTFDLGKNLDFAASDVQNAVGTASARLPSAVTLTGVTVTKNAGTFVMAYGFPNGGRPVRLRVPAVQEADDP